MNENSGSSLKFKIVDTAEYVKNAMSFLKSAIVDKNELIEWFKKLCESLSDLVFSVVMYMKETRNVISKSQWDPVLVYFTHTLNTLSFLIEVLDTENGLGEAIKEVRNFVIKGMNWCMEHLQEAMTNGTELEDCCGSFLKCMDLALNNLANFDIDASKQTLINHINQIRTVIEEVLAHAMTVAQVAAEDSNMIKGNCHGVLKILEELMQELSNEQCNRGMCALYIETCNDKLCLLERRVNTVVLKLCLQVFADYTVPLDKVYEYCFNDGIKTENELDTLVADFDLHVDRIMQIAYFAVSCSTETPKIIQMKSCIASLEALEIELVPALTTLTVDRSLQSENYAKLLHRYWIQQTKKLQNLIYLIIDPAAFCQVTYEALRKNLEIIKDSMEKYKTIDKAIIQNIIDNTNVIINFTKISAEDESISSEFKTMKNKIEKVSVAVKELKCATNQLLCNNSENEKNYERIFKRCKIVTSLVKQVWLCIQDIPKEESKTSNELHSAEYIENDAIMDNKFLNHIIEKGKHLLTERSILNHSPHRIRQKQRSLISDLKDQNPGYKVSISKRMNFTSLRIGNVKSADQEMTDMLAALTGMSISELQLFKSGNKEVCM